MGGLSWETTESEYFFRILPVSILNVCSYQLSMFSFCFCSFRSPFCRGIARTFRSIWWDRKHQCENRSTDWPIARIRIHCVQSARRNWKGYGCCWTCDQQQKSWSKEGKGTPWQNLCRWPHGWNQRRRNQNILRSIWQRKWNPMPSIEIEMEWTGRNFNAVCFLLFAK